MSRKIFIAVKVNKNANNEEMSATSKRRSKSAEDRKEL
jgi:hypothetical protein